MEKLEQMNQSLIDNRDTAEDEAIEEADTEDPELTPEQQTALVESKALLAERQRQLKRACSFRNFQKLAEAIDSLNKVVTILHEYLDFNSTVYPNSEVHEVMTEEWPKAKSAIDLLDV